MAFSHFIFKVTLDGIRYVIDCGKHKTRGYDGRTGMESLDIKNISKAQVRDVESSKHYFETIIC